MTAGKPHFTVAAKIALVNFGVECRGGLPFPEVGMAVSVYSVYDVSVSSIFTKTVLTFITKPIIISLNYNWEVTVWTI